MKKVDHIRVAHALGGVLALTGLLLSIYVNINWLWLTAFVGLNLLQNSITNWCLISDILHILGVKDTGRKCRISKDF